MRKMLLVAAAAFAALASGCVNYDERIELNPDGSGIVRMHLAIAEQVINPTGSMKIEKEDDLLPSSRKEMIADIEKQGFTVKSVRAELAGGLRHYYIVLAFKSLNDLQKSDMFGGRKASLKREGGKMIFSSEIAVSEKTLTDRAGGPRTPETPPKETPKDEKKTTPAESKEKDATDKKKDEPYVSVIKQLEMRFGKERVRQMFGAYAISFSVEMNGATLLKTNGVNYRDTTAIWETPLDKLIATWPTIEMQAEFAMPTESPAPAPAAEAPAP